MATEQFSISEQFRPGHKIAVMDVTSATNERTVICAVIPPCPTGHSITTLQPASANLFDTLSASAILNSLTLDYAVRLRLGGNHLSGFAIEDVPIPLAAICRLPLALATLQLNGCHAMFSPMWVEARCLLENQPFCGSRWAIASHERLRIRSLLDCIVALLFGLSRDDIYWILRDCDHSRGQLAEKAFCRGLDPKGFWRIDKDKDPELRHTVLTLVAFHDLEDKIHACGGDREQGIEAFLSQNDGEGWMLPETLCLADYGLGHDERAKHAQPVASRLGPRFYDWQLAQSPEESWRECHLHARNLLGKHGYLALLAEVIRDAAVDSWEAALVPAYELTEKAELLPIFIPAFAGAPVETWHDRLEAMGAILHDRGFTVEPADLITLFFNILKRAPEDLRSAMLAAACGLMEDKSYRELVARLEAEEGFGGVSGVAQPTASYSVGKSQRTLFD